MDNTFDDFDGAIDDINVERKKNKFELVQLKLEHYYFNSGDIDAGMPLSTSIELSCNYNFEKAKLEWTKIVSHTYLSLNNPHENVTDTYTEEVSNIEQLIREIEKYDLRDLKNNYFTEENPDSFTHWELTYNHYFKIVGTYDQEIEEFSKIGHLLEFRKIIEDETKKVQDKIRQSEI